MPPVVRQAPPIPRRVQPSPKVTIMIDMVTSNATGVFVKKATPDDIPAILDVAKATWEPTYREILSKTQIDFMYDEIYTPASLENQMHELEHTFLILYKGDLPIGYASYGIKSEGDTKVYKLHKLYIRPDVQGSGFGRTLLMAVEKEVRQIGAATLELNVNRYNPAIRFYERCGYSQYKQEVLPMGEFWMNDFVMRKELR
jgi:GNAT superfamily N-acetyltransferase